MSTDDCIFCKIAAGAVPCHKLYENEMVLAFLDIGPISTGHTLVIPKHHFAKLDECTEDVVVGVACCLGRIAKAVIKAAGVKAYNNLCNNGNAAGQLVGHVHFHIIPRSPDDGVFSRWPAGEYDEGQAEIIADKIREEL